MRLNSSAPDLGLRVERGKGCVDAAKSGLVEWLCLTYEAQLVKYLTRMLGCAEQAREVAQESFAALLVAYVPEKIRFPRAALFKVATRFALMQLRRRGMERRYWGQPVELECVKDALPDDDALPAEQEVMAEQVRDRLAAAVKEMHPAYRRVFVMALLQGKSRKEIAVAVGASERRVDKRMTKAIKVCRARLAAEGMRLTDLLSGAAPF